MRRQNRPGVDQAIESQHGTTRDGQPLSYNRAPAPDLAPWVARLYATVVEAPDDYRLDCGLLNDISIIRIQLKGDWVAETADGVKQLGRAALVFGPQSRIMPISVTGSFISVGVWLRPGTGHAFSKIKTSDYLDRFAPVEEVGLPGAQILQKLERSSDPERWLQDLEEIVRMVVTGRKPAEPDPITARFEALSFVNPSASIAEFAREQGIDQRRLERTVRRDFGMSPKQVLRRARALDMASYLRGVADQAEADELALRYYDQSHLIREFVELFGMTPSQFVERPQPLMTLSLETRQARRLEAMERLSPGQSRPWE